MAIDMGSELENQNRMVDRINTKVIKLCSILNPISKCMHRIFHSQSICIPYHIRHISNDVNHWCRWRKFIDLSHTCRLFVRFFPFLFSSLIFRFCFSHANTGRIQRNKDSGGKRTSSSASQINSHFLCLTLFYSSYVYLILINLNLNYIINIYIHSHKHKHTCKYLNLKYVSSAAATYYKEKLNQKKIN